MADTQPTIQPSARWQWAAVVILWAAVVGVGFAWLADYKSVPGPSAHPPPSWPADSRIAFDPHRANLVMLVHPHCPCTRASIAELARIMTQGQGSLTAHVLCLKPDGFSGQWTQTDLWRSAAAIPGVRVLCDDEGREAARFGAATSGSVVLYDRRGSRRFSGGITGARGHVGDNAGSRSVISLLAEGGTALRTTPVFGCPLFGTATEL